MPLECAIRIYFNRAGNFPLEPVSNFGYTSDLSIKESEIMEPRKMAGWCLILFGVINVLHAVYLHGTQGRGMTVLYALVTSLLFTLGAAFLLLNRKGRSGS